ncbi:MAG: hypothetical protein HRU76_00655 [Phycisphaeraceae bacterium]|nr:hypothetical protein [Phycisphaerales bacterium]QOJ16196.1 MAG: hypothetical protein HRU76_00655 [Phycisphaeraceae bacterium]
MRYATFAVTLLLASLLVGCGGDSAEAVSKDMVANMKEMASILTGITDEASAKAAVPRIEAVRAKMQECGRRAKEVPPIDAATEQRIAKMFEKEMGEAMQSIFAAQQRLMAKPELLAIIAPAMENMEDDL